MRALILILVLMQVNVTGYRDVVLRLADLGSAVELPRPGDKKQRLQDYIVTRPYRPPEVMLGLPLTSAADVWSVGCILMELVQCGALFDQRAAPNHVELISMMVQCLGVPEGEFIKQVNNSPQIMQCLRRPCASLPAAANPRDSSCRAPRQSTSS